ncbi:MAG TPA: 4-hydroxybenzoate octaprenyltransferase [Nitrospiraceae bacterium]|nr:4-hydroxybenzoate octaprenyltransferase [Nitrospiraceae bacterium]
MHGTWPAQSASNARIVPPLAAFGRLIRLKSQTGTFLLLLPTLWALVLASRGLPPWRLMIIFLIGSFLMRSAGVVLNDLADRSLDRHVTRTQSRPLASGELTPGHAIAILIVLVALAAMLLLLLDPMTIMLSPMALLLAALYPFAKRVIHIPQAMLGLAFGWGTIMAWSAAQGTVTAPAWCIYAATLCWAIGYDTIYALQDQDDDRRIGIKSSAILFGSRTWLAVGVALGGMLLFLSIAGWLTQVGWFFYLVLIAVGFFFAWQIRRLRRNVSASTALSMFQQHAWIGTAILGGLLGSLLL